MNSINYKPILTGIYKFNFLGEDVYLHMSNEYHKVITEFFINVNKDINKFDYYCMKYVSMSDTVGVYFILLKFSVDYDIKSMIRKYKINQIIA